MTLNELAEYMRKQELTKKDEESLISFIAVLKVLKILRNLKT